MVKGPAGAARSFGVTDYDTYWVKRRSAGTDRLTRLQRFLADVVAGLVPPGGKVLDCGVGPGNVYRLLAEAGRRMYGVEISDEAFSLYDFDASGIVKYDLNEGLPNFGERFDAIIAAHIIHHLEAPERYLDAVKRALAPGGVLVAAIPNITYYRYRLGFLAGKFPPISLAHRNFQTPLEFEAMAAASGLDVVSRASAKRTLGGRLFPTFFSQDIVYVLRPASGSAGCAAASSPRPGAAGR